jgi:hypothetical protein
MVTMEQLAEELAYLRAAVNELLDRVRGPTPIAVPEPSPQQEFWENADGTQRIPTVTGDRTTDFTIAMMGGLPAPTPERDAALTAHDAAMNAQLFAGRYPADSLTDEQAAFVYAVTHLEPNRAAVVSNHLYWHAWMFSGRRDAIVRLINRGELAGLGRQHRAIVDDFPDGEFKRDIILAAEAAV